VLEDKLIVHTVLLGIIVQVPQSLSFSLVLPGLIQLVDSMPALCAPLGSIAQMSTSPWNSLVQMALTRLVGLQAVQIAQQASNVTPLGAPSPNVHLGTTLLMETWTATHALSGMPVPPKTSLKPLSALWGLTVSATRPLAPLARVGIFVLPPHPPRDTSVLSALTASDLRPLVQFVRLAMLVLFTQRPLLTLALLALILFLEASTAQSVLQAFTVHTLMSRSRSPALMASTLLWALQSVAHAQVGLCVTQMGAPSSLVRVDTTRSRETWIAIPVLQATLVPSKSWMWRSSVRQGCTASATRQPAPHVPLAATVLRSPQPLPLLALQEASVSGTKPPVPSVLLDMPVPPPLLTSSLPARSGHTLLRANNPVPPVLLVQLVKPLPPLLSPVCQDTTAAANKRLVQSVLSGLTVPLLTSLPPPAQLVTTALVVLLIARSVALATCVAQDTIPTQPLPRPCVQSGDTATQPTPTPSALLGPMEWWLEERVLSMPVQLVKEGFFVTQLGVCLSLAISVLLVPIAQRALRLPLSALQDPTAPLQDSLPSRPVKGV
jgi:hypothetical protein